MTYCSVVTEEVTDVDAIADNSNDYHDLQSKFRVAAEATRSSLCAVLAGVMSLEFGDDRDGQRFTPMVTWADGTTSFAPTDLSEDQIGELAAFKTSNPAIRARVADILWEFASGAERTKRAHEAVDAYIELSGRVDGFLTAKYLERSYEVATRFSGADTSQREERILDLLRRQIAASGTSLGLLGRSARFLRSVGSDKDQLLVPPILESAAAAMAEAGSFRAARDILVEYRRWAIDDAQRADVAAQIADLWVREADSRLDGPERSAAVASSFVESAIQELRSIPRKQRARLNVDATIAALRARLADHNEESLDEMEAVRTDPVDLSNSVAEVSARVSGQDLPNGLLQLSRIVPLANEEADRAAAATALEGTVAQIFGHTTLTSDGRVSDKSGEGEAVDRQVAFSARLRRELVVHGAILPALRTLRREHSLGLHDFISLARDSAVVPRHHEHLIAEALYAGWNFEFGSAVHILAPQTESVVRHHLKAAGVLTTRLDAQGVEDEVSLSSLLEKREVGDVFGTDVAYELRGLFTGRFGSNLRHDVAHGLATDSIAHSAVAVYAWWLIFRLVMTPFWNRAAAAGSAEPSNDGESGDAGDASRNPDQTSEG